MSLTSLEQLEVKGADLKAALARIGDMRPGSLSETYGKCRKSTCHCAKPGSRGHGPSWLLMRTVDGKTVARGSPLDQRSSNPSSKWPSTSAFVNSREN
jgi:hypothetical protein